VRPEAVVQWLRRTTAVLCTASAALFVMMNLLEFLYFRRLSGGLSSLDPRIMGFTTDEAVAWLAALGEPGREAVLVWHYSSFDLFFPVLFGLSLAGLFLHGAARSGIFSGVSKRAQLAYAVAVPLPFVIVDYAQNLLVARMLTDPSAATVWLVSLASRLVTAKFLLAVAALLIVAAVFLRRRA
jgi:hypothetical protein